MEFLCAAAFLLWSWLLRHEPWTKGASDLHAVLVSAWGLVVLLGGLSEAPLAAVSVAYYLADLAHKRTRGDVWLHHGLTLLLFARATQSPYAAAHRCRALVLQIEWTLPFLNAWKRRRHDRWRYAALVAAYAANRVVWFGWIAWCVFPTDDPCSTLVHVLHALLCAWWLQLVRTGVPPPRTVLTCGTFDLLHPGHVRVLERARALGDRLVVGVSSDALNTTKGKTAHLPLAARLEVVSALRCVDATFVEETLEAKASYVRDHNAALFVIGDDWKGKFDDLPCPTTYLSRTEGISSTELRAK